MFDTILCASDGFENGDRALAFACRMAEPRAASLRVVHVTMKLPGGWDAYEGEERVIFKLKAQVGSLRWRGIDATLHVIRAGAGHVPQLIADTAKAVDADVVVVGTNGHSPMRSAALGEVTARLLHLAPCPVLAVPRVRPSEHHTVSSAQGTVAAA